MIKISALAENTAVSSEYACRHGLSLYIETSGHKILFDLGRDNVFLENARKKNIDLSEVDTVIISHGHNDHGGALKKFLSVNSKARIYIRREAFEPHYIKVLGLPVNIGLDKRLADSGRFVFCGEETHIYNGLLLFSGVKNSSCKLQTNSVLYVKRQGCFVKDDFSHEQNLIITDNQKNILISGCSHSGITNIMNTAKTVISGELTTVIGGFHLYNPPTKKYESNEVIDRIANELSESGADCYTCHCTGIKAYDRIRLTLREKLHYLSAGMDITV